MPIAKKSDNVDSVQVDSSGMFDDDIQPEETIAPAPVMAEPEPEVLDAPVAVSEPAPASRKIGQSSAKGEVVQVGLVEGQLLLMPLADVLGLLLDDLRLKIVELAERSPNEALEKWMRDTEGRCAPAFFTVENDVPSFFYGSQELAIAMRLGFTDVFVILVANSDSGAVQKYLQEQMLKRRPQEDEDDLIFRAAAFYDM